jgi:hypothetical protein
VNRLQKVLEEANPKLARVASDVLGVSGRPRLEGRVAGTPAATVLPGGRPADRCEFGRGTRDRLAPLPQARAPGLLSGEPTRVS